MKILNATKYLLTQKMRGVQVLYHTIGDDVWIGTPYALWRFNRSDNMLNLDHLEHRDMEWSLKQDSVPAERLSEVYVTPRGVETLIFKDAEGNRVYADRSFFSYFDKDFTVEINKRYGGIKVYEDGKLVGLVLPIEVQEEEK